MTEEIFAEQFDRLKGAFPTAFNKQSEITWFKEFERIDDDKFTSYVNYALHSDAKPSIGRVYHHINTDRETAVGSLSGVQMKEIVQLCKRLGLNLGNAQLMINKKFEFEEKRGYIWRTLPSRAFEPVKEWLEENHKFELEITRPSVHEELLKSCDEYRNEIALAKNALEKKDRVADQYF